MFVKNYIVFKIIPFVDFLISVIKSFVDQCQKKCKFPGNLTLISHELLRSFLNIPSTIVKFCTSCTFKVAVF